VTLARRARARIRPLERLINFENRRFDERYGIDAEGYAEPEDLTVEGEPRTGFTYVATPVRLGRWWLRELPVDPARFTFVDMGSGKGRVLALAAAHGFGRVIGVEFARELHEIAVRNAGAARARGLDFEPILGDAAEFEFPDAPLVAHFNNPFAESVMRRVLTNLARSYESHPRPVVVVYQQLTVEEDRHSTRNLVLLDDLPFLRGRSLARRGLVDRRVLAPFTARLYESVEVG
jgi:SAM-dependent methyltransferase